MNQPQNTLKLLVAIKLVRTSWIKCVDPSREEALVTLVWD
jgi:hypothetical protein